MAKPDYTRKPMQWFTMDLHLHTPASSDYLEPGISYLDILRRAETRGLDIIGFADHNTVAGYRRMQAEIEQLRLLRSLKRILAEEELPKEVKTKLTFKFVRTIDEVLKYALEPHSVSADGRKPPAAARNGKPKRRSKPKAATHA